MLVTVFAVALGWYVDRAMYLDAKLIENETRYLGYAHYVECLESLRIAEVGRDGNASEFQSFMECELCRCIIDACRNREEIDLSEKARWTSFELAYRALKLLDCHSHSDFIDFASQTRISEAREEFIEIFEPESMNYQILKGFISQTIGSQGEPNGNQ